MGSLTVRELEVLTLTARDCLSAKEIGDRLLISPTTAKNHIKNIKAKLNMQKVSELCRYYYTNIIATFLLLIILPSAFQPNNGMIRVRRAGRNRQETEFILQVES
ncbi:response regulator transcription factor [Proteiniphilum sp. X52]|uniref:response regulator transcription factor n=1 Tax=Proteiniphilum sp. X52 TaxID=2382159 RepID=UPI000F0A1592|nr:helix-turn-helix transcriptional regulator [Proteiniphilum sp. X52]RNC66436.1 LuxR family transcriptional regulator [Proteiniphilum sp. X52]